MVQHKIVSREEWIEARKAHMAHEKELTRARDRLNEERRALPWVKVDKPYVFDGPAGKVTLADLFKSRPQLVVQHVMFKPEWDAACKSCSFWADGFERMVPHLAARDTTLVAVSLAPIEKLEAFKKRLGWSFDWVSSGANDFNADYGVTFTREQIGKGENGYNFGTTPFYGEELPGISVFYRDEGRRHLPHLFVLCARPRHDERRLPLSRPHTARPPRGGPALSDGLGAPARSVSERRQSGLLSGVMFRAIIPGSVLAPRPT